MVLDEPYPNWTRKLHRPEKAFKSQVLFQIHTFIDPDTEQNEEIGFPIVKTLKIWSFALGSSQSLEPKVAALTINDVA